MYELENFTLFLLLFAGIAFSKWGLSELFKVRRIKRGFMRQKGQVVDFEVTHSTSSGRSTEMYAPVIEYKVLNQNYRFIARISSSQKSVSRNEWVDILVNPDEYSEAYQLSSDLMVFPVAASIVGAIMTLAGLGLIYYVFF